MFATNSILWAFLIVGVTGAYAASEMAERAETQARRVDWIIVVVLNVLQASGSVFMLLMTGKDEPEEE